VGSEGFVGRDSAVDRVTVRVAESMTAEDLDLLGTVGKKGQQY
jgi:hypothetical protein